MPENTIIPNYLDPVYTQIKNEFAQKSDAHPVALLPVRLETRFMNETRYIFERVPGQTYIDSFVTLSHKLVKISFFGAENITNLGSPLTKTSLILLRKS